MRDLVQHEEITSQAGEKKRLVENFRGKKCHVMDKAFTGVLTKLWNVLFEFLVGPFLFTLFFFFAMRWLVVSSRLQKLCARANGQNVGSECEKGNVKMNGVVKKKKKTNAAF